MANTFTLGASLSSGFQRPSIFAQDAISKSVERDRQIDVYKGKLKFKNLNLTVHRGTDLQGGRVDTISVTGSFPKAQELLDQFKANPYANSYTSNGYQYNRLPNGTWDPRPTPRIDAGPGLQLAFGSKAFANAPKNSGPSGSGKVRQPGKNPHKPKTPTRDEELLQLVNRLTPQERQAWATATAALKEQYGSRPEFQRNFRAIKTDLARRIPIKGNEQTYGRLANDIVKRYLSGGTPIKTDDVIAYSNPFDHNGKPGDTFFGGLSNVPGLLGREFGRGSGYWGTYFGALAGGGQATERELIRAGDRGAKAVDDSVAAQLLIGFATGPIGAILPVLDAVSQSLASGDAAPLKKLIADYGEGMNPFASTDAAGRPLSLQERGLRALALATTLVMAARGGAAAASKLKQFRAARAAGKPPMQAVRETVADLRTDPSVRHAAKAAGIDPDKVADQLDHAPPPANPKPNAPAADRKPNGTGLVRADDGLELSEYVQRGRAIYLAHRAKRTPESSLDWRPQAALALPGRSPMSPGLRTVVDFPELLRFVDDAQLQAWRVTRDDVLSGQLKLQQAYKYDFRKTKLNFLKPMATGKGKALLKALAISLGAIEKHHVIPRSVAKYLRQEHGLNLEEYNWTVRLPYRLHRDYHKKVAGQKRGGGYYNNDFFDRIEALEDRMVDITRDEILRIMDEVQALFPKLPL